MGPSLHILATTGIFPGTKAEGVGVRGQQLFSHQKWQKNYLEFLR